MTFSTLRRPQRPPKKGQIFHPPSSWGGGVETPRPPPPPPPPPPLATPLGSGADFSRTMHDRTNLRPDLDSVEHARCATAFRFCLQRIKNRDLQLALRAPANRSPGHALPLRRQWQRYLENETSQKEMNTTIRLSESVRVRNCLSFCDTTKNKQVKKWKKLKFFIKNTGLFLRKCRKFPKKFAGVSRKLITLYGHALNMYRTWNLQLQLNQCTNHAQSGRKTLLTIYTN